MADLGLRAGCDDYGRAAAASNDRSAVKQVVVENALLLTGFLLSLVAAGSLLAWNRRRQPSDWAELRLDEHP